MPENGAPDSELYHIVVNHEEQYSIWPAARTVPAGWQIVGEAARRERRRDLIEEMWVDMTPKSARAHCQPRLRFETGGSE